MSMRIDRLVMPMVVILTVATVCMAGSAYGDGGGQAPEFPSIGEIFSTIEFPDYTFQTFLDDVGYVFSPEMLGNIGNHLGGLFDYIGTETFLSDLGNVSAAFEGDNAYINIFFLLALLIALVCVLGALVTYLSNRKTFQKNRN